MRGAAHVGFATATHAVWWIDAACGVLVIALALASTSGWARSTATRVAHLVDEPAVAE
jgi:hypothetical protein